MTGGTRITGTNTNGHETTAAGRGCLVRALWEERRQHHQIRQAKQPLVRVSAGSFCSARDESQMAALGEIVDVLDADPGQTCHFRIGEDFLARLDGYHCLAPGPRSLPMASFYFI
jgi:hypothetical protein